MSAIINSRLPNKVVSLFFSFFHFHLMFFSCVCVYNILSISLRMNYSSARVQRACPRPSPPPTSSYCTCIYPADDTELYISYLYSKRENGKKGLGRKKIFSFLFFLRLFGSEGYCRMGIMRTTGVQVDRTHRCSKLRIHTHTHKRRKKKKGRCEIRSIHPPDDLKIK